MQLVLRPRSWAYTNLGTATKQVRSARRQNSKKGKRGNGSRPEHALHWSICRTQGVCRARSRSPGKSEEEDSSYLEEGDQQWLLMAHQGLHMLFRCSKALSYTYPFALFEGKMLKSKMLFQKNLFEDLQERHQLYVERLSMRVEAPVHEVKAESIKLGWKLSP